VEIAPGPEPGVLLHCDYLASAPVQTTHGAESLESTKEKGRYGRPFSGTDFKRRNAS
jgi:hypothetical protein